MPSPTSFWEMILTINLLPGVEEEWKQKAIMTRMQVIYWWDNKFNLMFDAPKLNDSKLQGASNEAKGRKKVRW